MSKLVVKIVLASVALLVGAFDVVLLLDGVEGNTISSIIQGQDWLIGLLGFASVHVSRKPDGINRPWSLVALGAVASIFVAQFVGGGVIALILGGIAGWFTWGNSGKT